MVATAEEEEASEGSNEPPGDDYDARVRVARHIVARRGQGAFRAALMAAYGGRCAFTGTRDESVLEAAHIRPYRGDESNVVPYGPLLRADIHTLFDLQLIAVDPKKRTIVTSKRLTDDTYTELDGRPLRGTEMPMDAPAKSALDDAWKRFLDVESGRREDSAGTPTTRNPLPASLARLGRS